MRFVALLFLLVHFSSSAIAGNRINIQDSSQKEKVHLNVFVGTGLSLYQGVGDNFRLSPAFPLNLSIKARYGAVTAGAFGQISQSLGRGYDYAYVNSTGIFAVAGYYGKQFSIGAGGGGAAIFSTEYVKGGPVSSSQINVLASNRYYNQFGYCANVFISFNDLSDWARISLQFCFLKSYSMKVVNLVVIGVEIGRR